MTNGRVRKLWKDMSFNGCVGLIFVREEKCGIGVARKAPISWIKCGR